MTERSREAARPIHPLRRTIRFYLSRLLVAVITRGWLRMELEGRERLPDGPAIYAFNHLSWSDPFVLMATMPLRPRLHFFGPREEDMRAGGRNRLMLWTGSAIPYKPGKNDLLEATRRVGAVIAAGGVVAIAGEGRIGAIEGRLLPLNDGPAYFALRSRVPLVPIAIIGSSWLRFGARVRVRIGEPIVGEGRPDRAAVAAMTATLTARLQGMLDGAQEPDRSGRLAAWMTDRFNEWPEGSREAALAAQGTEETMPPAQAV
ncbi:MAG TPA: lysophospholipid acyltransferase family protein [Candidatus Limnocylindrales bacterium]|nr:lysophospholipid acyltransferase family protein [Candidatus Limnocylindrales bacterium]